MNIIAIYPGRFQPFGNHHFKAFEALEKLLADNPPYTQRLIKTPEAGLIEVKDLIATAPKRTEPILKGLNAKFKSGDVVVIVGPSGSGKSTFARCLLGIWPFVTSGEVSLDGEDVRLWDKNLLGPHIGYLPQDIELLDGTIAENIARFGDVDSEKVIQAASSVGIHDTILRMPQGYDTPIGEAGRRLSGGQRQRLGLARALYGQPMMMVLDEPNANLDDVGEIALYKVVSEMRAQGKTIFLISHRPAAMQIADVIVLMNKGEIQAMGPKEQILNNAASQNIS
jgi:ATP-binding cassette subfamily C exporter for protease/lipase